MSTDIQLARLLKRCLEIFAEDIYPADQYIEMRHAARALDEWIEKELKEYAKLVEFENEKGADKAEGESKLFLDLCRSAEGRKRRIAKCN